MQVQDTNIQGAFVLIPEEFKDHRGSFIESYNASNFQKATGLNINWIQDNQSVSTRGVLRGLHMQTGKYAQSKLLRVIAGEIQDVIVDCRKDSATYGTVFSIDLSSKNLKQLYVPKGCAHGFLVLSQAATVAYKCDAFYHKASEAGIHFNDPDLDIPWKLDVSKMLLSDKDLELPLFKDIHQ